jgi:hypothetical protein
MQPLGRPKELARPFLSVGEATGSKLAADGVQVRSLGTDEWRSGESGQRDEDKQREAGSERTRSPRTEKAMDGRLEDAVKTPRLMGRLSADTEFQGSTPR